MSHSLQGNSLKSPRRRKSTLSDATAALDPGMFDQEEALVQEPFFLTKAATFEPPVAPTPEEDFLDALEDVHRDNDSRFYKRHRESIDSIFEENAKRHRARLQGKKVPKPTRLRSFFRNITHTLRKKKWPGNALDYLVAIESLPRHDKKGGRNTRRKR